MGSPPQAPGGNILVARHPSICEIEHSVELCPICSTQKGTDSWECSLTAELGPHGGLVSCHTLKCLFFFLRKKGLPWCLRVPDRPGLPRCLSRRLVKCCCDSCQSKPVGIGAKKNGINTS